MKTLEQFVKDNEGQFLEVAGSSNAKFQCVDCVNGYIRDVLGFPIIEWTNAIDFKNKANGNYDIIYNDINNPSLVPDVGDIVVYRHPNKIGHIGVCIKKGVASSFGIFEENWPVGSPCKSVLTKKYIIGDYVVDYWMRPKKSIIEDMTDTEKRILEVVNSNNLTEGDVRWLAGLIKDQTVPNLEKKVAEFEKEIESFKVKISEFEAKFVEKQELIDTWQKRYESANTKLEKSIQNIDEITKDRDEWRSRYNNKNDQYNNDLTIKVQEMLSNKSAFDLIKLGFKKLFIK